MGPNCYENEHGCLIVYIQQIDGWVIKESLFSGQAGGYFSDHVSGPEEDPLLPLTGYSNMNRIRMPITITRGYTPEHESVFQAFLGFFYQKPAAF